MHSQTSDNRASARGFTLTELLVVVLIITILISLLVPALSAVRNSARGAATRALMQSVNTSISNYRADNDQNLPGVFRQDQLPFVREASSEMRLTAMENAIIDLAGGEVVDQNDANLTFRNSLSPGANDVRTVNIATGAIGASNGPGYLDLGESFVPVEGQLDDPPASNAAAGPQRIPDVIDPFGQPLLLWQRDTFAGKTAPIASIDGDPRAQFYIETNAAYFNSEELGGRSVNQSRFSLLTDRSARGDRLGTLRAIVGNPATPSTSRVSTGFDDASFSGVLAPALPRGDVVLMSAGEDRIYLDRRAGDSEWDGAAYVPSGDFDISDIGNNAKPIEEFDEIIIGGSG